MSAGGEHTRDGRLVGGRYRLAERVGSGGMGTVWRAYDELVQRDVAVKQPRLPGDPEDEAHRRAAGRLYREARAAARVDHPAAVSIHDVVVEEDGLPWIVMELIRGESLHQVLERGPVDAPEVARIGLAVLGALRAAHAVGIVHRDVKPANVLLGPHGRVVLTDFGIAHVQGEESLTVSGEFVGSLEFVAPERMSGPGAGPASDLWSLGVLLYAAVEGESPFRRTTLESTLAAVIAAEPPEPKQAGPLGPLIARLLVKDPERRPAAEETAAALEAVAEGRPVPEGGPDGKETEAQDTSGLREFAEDVGTVRLAAEPVPDPPAAEKPEPEPAADPVRPRARPLLRHPAPLALLGALLVGGGWLGASHFGDSGDSAVTGHTATYSSAPATAAWTSHPEKAMKAVLYLPRPYTRSAGEGPGDGRPRFAVYTSGDLQVRLGQWDVAPGSPLEEAKRTAATLGELGRSESQYTDTTFRGDPAVQADTTYERDGTPTRVMQLIVRTDDNRMYELRVDMPKGTADEKKGTALFKGARDRLVIGKSRTTSGRTRTTP
ncbi:serine/threonine-protein kinase [Streptomyces sp. NPDC001663]|uniref:serine/threonine-protein kinase n=1 Tax=Streptomyces sp. NPDC001663 TaxID=3364597 RepID=UPI003686CA09